jgi:hypothetical protein
MFFCSSLNHRTCHTYHVSHCTCSVICLSERADHHVVRMVPQRKSARTRCFFPKLLQTRLDASDVSSQFQMRLNAFGIWSRSNASHERVQTHLIDASRRGRCFILAAFKRVLILAFQTRLKFVFRRVQRQKMFTWVALRSFIE